MQRMKSGWHSVKLPAQHKIIRRGWERRSIEGTKNTNEEVKRGGGTTSEKERKERWCGGSGREQTVRKQRR